MRYINAVPSIWMWMISRLLLLNWPSLLSPSPSMAPRRKLWKSPFGVGWRELCRFCLELFLKPLGNLEAFEAALRFPSHVARFALPSSICGSRCICEPGQSRFTRGGWLPHTSPYTWKIMKVPFEFRWSEWHSYLLTCFHGIINMANLGVQANNPQAGLKYSPYYVAVGISPTLQQDLILVPKVDCFIFTLNWNLMAKVRSEKLNGKIWRFPKIGVPPVIIHSKSMFPELNHFWVPPWRAGKLHISQPLSCMEAQIERSYAFHQPTRVRKPLVIACYAQEEKDSWCSLVDSPHQKYQLLWYAMVIPVKT